jgi:hypothetical protein
MSFPGSYFTGLMKMRVALQSIHVSQRRGSALLLLCLVGAIVFPALGGAICLAAQAAPSPAGSQIGTVKTVTPNKLTIETKAGITVSVNVIDGARVLQLAPGSTDLKSAHTIAMGDIEVGDRVLVTGHIDAPDALTASRVILMKSTDIAQKHQAEQEDWQKRGTGGLVNSVDPSSGTVTITARAKKIAVQTTPSTVFRRYAGDSVKFEDAKPSNFSEIETGDQLRVRGAKSDDGMSIKAEEVVSGSFQNLAGTIVAVDSSSGMLTLKDLATKKTYSIKVTPNSNVRALPPEAAARFAAREKAAPQAAVAAAGNGPASGAGSAGADLSQMVNRLPQGTLADLHTGQALIIVASQPEAAKDSLTAITLLSGVEPILAATPKGEASMTLSPWSLGGADGGGM